MQVTAEIRAMHDPAESQLGEQSPQKQWDGRVPSIQPQKEPSCCLQDQSLAPGLNLWCHPLCRWNSQGGCRKSVQSLGVQHNRPHSEQGLSEHRAPQPQRTGYPGHTEEVVSSRDAENAEGTQELSRG